MKKKILVIDDDESLRTCLVEFLQINGWDTYSAADGKDGFRKIKELVPDLAITDLKLPSMSGIEICQMVKNSGLKVPVILTSAKSDIQQIAETAGTPYFLQKPFNVVDFIETVKKTLARNQAAKDASSDDD